MEANIKEPRIIMAKYDDKVVRVYQAYNDIIADQAVKNGTFGPAFKMERMTWIKPSFLWMMYRAGWATKEGQERILAIDLDRNGFDEILSKAVLSTYDKELYGTAELWKERLAASDVRCQWDPDRDVFANPIGRRAIQLGLSGDIVRKYVHEWIVKITDITKEVRSWHKDILADSFDYKQLPEENEYRVRDDIGEKFSVR